MIFQQWLVGFGVTIFNMQVGFMTGWLSPTLARLTAPDSPLPMTLDEASWLASLSNIARLLGAVVGAVLLSKLGSKRTIFATLWPIAIGWFFVIVADKVEWLYASRLMLGVGLGIMLASFPLYIGEVSIPEIRGALIAAPNVGAAFGKVISSTFGVYLDMEVAALIYFVEAVFGMLLFYWLPESPHHLVKVGNRNSAEKSIRWYRNGQEVEKELEAVERFVSDASKQSFAEKCRECKTPVVRKAIFQLIILMTFMQVCGINSILFYMETILKSAKFNLFNPASLVIYVNATGIFASIFSSVLIDRCGRKFLMFVSSSGVCLSMLMLSASFSLSEFSEDSLYLQLLPMMSMFLFMITYFLGFMCVPSTILSEIFPSSIKSIAALIASLTAAVMSFLAVKTYQPMINLMGESTVFLIYAVWASLATPYTYFFMRETKGKTLAEIQDDLRGR